MRPENLPENMLGISIGFRLRQFADIAANARKAASFDDRADIVEDGRCEQAWPAMLVMAVSSPPRDVPKKIARGTARASSTGEQVIQLDLEIIAAPIRIVFGAAATPGIQREHPAIPGFSEGAANHLEIIGIA